MLTDKDFQKFVIEHLVKLTEGQENIHQNIARLEFEHREKLAALFDGQEAIKNTLSEHTDRLQRIEEKIERHDIQIQVLDKTKSNKRKVK